jgi:hypothetical protein
MLCRLPDETAEICEVGRLLRDSDTRDVQFTFQEEGGITQHFQITTEVVQKMINNLIFRMPRIQIRIVKNLHFQAVLRWKSEDFPISGFPRILLRDPSQTMSKISFERAVSLSTDTYRAGQHQATQWVDLDKHHRKRWIMPALEELNFSSLGLGADGSPYELEGRNISKAATTERERQRTTEVEESSPRRAAADGKYLYSLASGVNYLTMINEAERTLLGVAGPSSHRKRPSTISEATSSATYNEDTTTGDFSEGSRYLTLKFSTNKGTLESNLQVKM